MTDGAPTTTHGRLTELLVYFLRLGSIGFGGPVALVGQMERELVGERGWLTKEQMREAIAICQSLPGPLAIQVGIYVGYLRGGFWGAWIGGCAFIFPNFVMVAALGALYVYLGDLKPITAIFYGVSPAVIALILHSCYRLAKLGMEDWLQWVIALVCLAVTVILQAEVAFLFIGAGIIGILYYGSLFRRVPGVKLQIAAVPLLIAPAAGTSTTLSKLLLFFLKAGSLTFGSGLVIVPFLQQGLVEQYGWLDERQFLIAVAVGMMSPGPVVITATFVGYLVAGFWGSLVSTIGIFLPSFIFILIAAPLLARHGKNPNVQGFVRGAYGAAIWHNPRRLHPAWPDCHWRLADSADWRSFARCSFPLEGKQSLVDRGNGSSRADCVSDPATGMGNDQISFDHRFTGGFTVAPHARPPRPTHRFLRSRGRAFSTAERVGLWVHRVDWCGASECRLFGATEVVDAPSERRSCPQCTSRWLSICAAQTGIRLLDHLVGGGKRL